MGGNGVREVGFERGFRREGGGDAPLAPADELGGGMVGGKSFGIAGEGVGVVEGEAAQEATVFDEGSELLVVLKEMAADGEELVWGRHVEACGEDELSAGEVEVVAGAGGFWHAGAAPPCGDVRLVGGFVGGEAGVAIDAEHDAVGGAYVAGGEADDGGVDGFDEGEHRSLDLSLVNGATGLEPLAAVVAAEAAEKAEGFLVEVGDGVLGVPGLRVSSGHRMIMTAGCCDWVRTALQEVEESVKLPRGWLRRGAVEAV